MFYVDMFYVDMFYVDMLICYMLRGSQFSIFNFPLSTFNFPYQLWGEAEEEEC